MRDIERRLLALLQKVGPPRCGTAWLPRSDYEALRREQPDLPEVVGPGSIVRLDQDGAWGTEGEATH